MHKNYIRGLDGLRGVAALMVFVLHVWSMAGYPEVRISLFSAFEIDMADFFVFGSKGVMLFFCLSGFLLSLPFWSALENPENIIDLQEYFRKRFYRIYPAYFVAVLVYLLLQGWHHPFFINMIFFVSHVALIHNFYEAFVYQISVPMWSVATEFQMYLILPIIFYIARKVKRYLSRDILLPFLIYLSAGLVGIAFLSIVTYILKNFTIPELIMRLNGGVIVTSPLIGLTHFGWGIFCAYLYLQIVRHLKKLNALVDIAAVLTFLLLLIAALFGLDSGLEFPPSGWPGAPILFGLLILFVSLSKTKSGAAAILEWKPMKFFGTISYSFYLYHDLVLVRVFRGLPDFFPGLFAANTLSKGVFAFTIAVLVSWLSYALVEKRLTAWLKRNQFRKPVRVCASQTWFLEGDTQMPAAEVKSASSSCIDK